MLGIDIGADKVLVIVADLTARCSALPDAAPACASGRPPTASSSSSDAATDEVLATAGVEPDSLQAVGVGTPGVVDPVSGQVTLAPQLGGWEGIRLGHRLEPAFPCSVLVDNEVHLSVLGERWRGSAQGIDDALYVQIGVGIGGGVLIGARSTAEPEARPARSITSRSSTTMRDAMGSGPSSTPPVEPPSHASAVARPLPARARQARVRRRQS